MDQATKAGPTIYHVFINHRGCDVKLSLASLIYHRLIEFGLRVFLDKNELLIGDTLDPVIRGAISSASVHIAIFSENYAASSWCLDELSWILKSSDPKPTIITVFCDVEPSNLRHFEEGPYAEAFKKHEGIHAMTVVNEWKAALIEASTITGETFKKDTSDQGEFLKKIVNRVLEVVKWDQLEVAKHPVGLDQALAEFESKIDIKERATKVVVIAGLAGAGKSSLAKHLFNSKRSDFSRSCYLSNVRGKDLTVLQRQLLIDLLGNNMNISNTDVVEMILRYRVRWLKILIVLDDVDDGRKLESLLDMDAVGPGSLILITCRDKNILENSSAKPLFYDVKPLPAKHAQELFCRHAFSQSDPVEEYKALLEKFLKICEGLPLCLKVFGKGLADNPDITYWTGQLANYRQGLPLPQADSVINTLKVSYSAMDDEEKDFFLDIGCFFLGEDTELAVRVLEGLGYHRDPRQLLEILHKKCLVDFDNYVEYHHEIESSGQDLHPFLIPTRLMYRNAYVDVESYLPAVLPRRSSKIIMQNQVRELARYIASEHLFKNTCELRLSHSIDIQKMLQKLQDESDFCIIRGIRIGEGQDPPQLSINIQGVRLLVLEHLMKRSFFGSNIKGNLVWLRLRNSGFTSIPSTISQRSLRVLEFHGPIDHVEGLFNQLICKYDKIPTELRELNVDPGTSNSCQHKHPMPSFYRFLGYIGTQLKYLNKIVLKNIPFVQSLPIDFSNLKCLRHLDLTGLTHLTELPTSLTLSPLQHLVLRDCKNLSIPVDILGEISTLEFIDFKGCVQLELLPRGIPKQKRLRYLNLLDTRLLELPPNLELLDNVEQLRIGSPELTKLPDSVASLKGLKELILSGCINLDDIRPIEKLKHLERLEIYESTYHLPPGILKLKNIKVLTIVGYEEAEFSFQTHSDVVNHDVMEALRDFILSKTSISRIHIPTEVFPRLEIVDLSYSPNLSQVQGFPSTLVSLSLESCSSLKTLTNLSNLVHLKFLNINGCEELESLNVEGLRSLEEINAEKCWKLQNIQGFNDLELVNFLTVSTSMDGRLFSDALDSCTKVMQFIAYSSEHLKVLEVTAATTVKTRVILNNALSESAIFMCFITSRVSSQGFRVCFEPSNDLAQYEYKTSGGDGSSGILLHMYLWTKDSRLFKDKSRYTKLTAYGSGNANNGEKGWIVTPASKAQVIEVWRALLNRQSRL